MPFEFQPYESRLTGTIADLIAAPGRIRAQALRAVGEARARAAEASGQRSAQLAQNLGQIASGTITAVVEDRERAKALRVQQQRESIIRAVLPKVINGEMPPETLLEAAGPEDGLAIIKGLESYRQLAGKRVTDARAMAGSLAAGLKKLPADMRASLWPRVRDAAIAGGLGDEQTIPAQANDQFLDAILAWSGEKPEAAPTLIQRDPTRDLVNPQTGAVVTPGTPAPVKPPTPPAVGSFEDYVVQKYGERPTPDQIMAARKAYGDAGRMTVAVNAGLNEEPQIAPDPASANILSQTGLSINAFRYLTGQAGQLPRDRVTRQQAAREASEWSRKHNVDISTMAAQYKAQNDVLAANIARLNNTKIMEQEILGTGQNLQTVVNDKDLGRLNVVNVARIWAGQEVNDNLAQQYAMHLSQLRNELTAYFAATQGRTGNNLTLEDKREAEGVIKNGLAKGSLAGLMTAIENSTGKMGAVMQGSVDRAQRAIWDLFGVGKNYKGGKGTSSNAPTHRFNPATGKVEVVK